MNIQNLSLVELHYAIKWRERSRKILGRKLSKLSSKQLEYYTRHGEEIAECKSELLRRSTTFSKIHIVRGWRNACAICGLDKEEIENLGGELKDYNVCTICKQKLDKQMETGICGWCGKPVTECVCSDNDLPF